MPNNNDLLFENTGNWDQAQLRQRDDLTIKPYFGYNVAENAERVRGTYRPIHNLPVVFRRGNRDDFEGFVFSQGKFLAKYDRLVASSGWTYQDDVQKLGVTSISTGKFKAFKKADGSLADANYDNEYWGSHGDIEGFLMPANGTNFSCQDYYGSLDTLFSIINPVDGVAINDTTVASGTKATLRNGLGLSGGTAKLSGVAIADRMRETRNNSYQYQRKIEAITVAKEGYLRLPFVIADAAHAGFLDTDWHSPVAGVSSLVNYQAAIAKKQFLASKDQTVLFVETLADLVSGAIVKIDMFGNPVLTSDTNYADPEAAGMGARIRLVDFNFEVRMPFGNETISYPGIDVASNSTGGVDAMVWALAKKLESTSLSINDLADLIIGGTNKYYGYATIYYDIP